MREWQGQISKIESKDWHDIVLHTFQIEGETRWFKTGRTKIPYNIGDLLKFSERNGKVIDESVQAIDAISTASAPAAEAATPTTAPPLAGDVGRRIQWQAARRDASNVVVAALHCDALPWATNVAKSKRLDLLRGYINELTKQFIEEEV